MNQELRDKRIEYRLSQARESLREADALFQASLLRGAINRAYYAMFYATLALAVLKSQAVSKHGGLIAFFDREFVRTGFFPKELSKALHLAFERRQSNDYGEVWLIDQIEAETSISEARGFVDAIVEYLAATNKSAE